MYRYILRFFLYCTIIAKPTLLDLYLSSIVCDVLEACTLLPCSPHSSEVNK